MDDASIVSDIRFSPATAADRKSGLLGWIEATVGHVRIDSVAVRRSRNGRYVLSFPQRRDRRGSPHPVVRPRDDASRRLLEEAVIRALGLDRDPDREEARP